MAAAAVLYLAAVCAGSGDLRSAAAAVENSGVARQLLRWELGQATLDRLPLAALVTLRQSPQLLSAGDDLRSSGADEVPQPSPAPDSRTDGGEPSPAPAPGGETSSPPLSVVVTDENGYTRVGDVFIKNASRQTLEGVSFDGTFAAALGDDAPQVLILHSHGSECYTPAPGADILYSGNHRSTDSRYNVVAAGDVMAEELEKAGIPVLHDRTLYDYPSYSGAYDRSLAAIETALTEYPSLRFILDVHRDAIEDAEGNEYKVLSETSQGSAAQLTLIVGSDGSGLPHPNWMENLRLAVALQNQIAGQEPTLMRPITVRNSRYNQFKTTGSLLVEVGTAGNSLEEAVNAARLFAAGFAETIQNKG